MWSQRGAGWSRDWLRALFAGAVLFSQLVVSDMSVVPHYNPQCTKPIKNAVYDGAPPPGSPGLFGVGIGYDPDSINTPGNNVNWFNHTDFADAPFLNGSSSWTVWMKIGKAPPGCHVVVMLDYAQAAYGLLGGPTTQPPGDIIINTSQNSCNFACVPQWANIKLTYCCGYDNCKGLNGGNMAIIGKRDEASDAAAQANGTAPPMPIQVVPFSGNLPTLPKEPVHIDGVQVFNEYKPPISKRGLPEIAAHPQSPADSKREAKKSHKSKPKRSSKKAKKNHHWKRHEYVPLNLTHEEGHIFAADLVRRLNEGDPELVQHHKRSLEESGHESIDSRGIEIMSPTPPHLRKRGEPTCQGTMTRGPYSHAGYQVMVANAQECTSGLCTFNVARGIEATTTVTSSQMQLLTNTAGEKFSVKASFNLLDIIKVSVTASVMHEVAKTVLDETQHGMISGTTMTINNIIGQALGTSGFATFTPTYQCWDVVVDCGHGPSAPLTQCNPVYNNQTNALQGTYNVVYTN